MDAILARPLWFFLCSFFFGQSKVTKKKRNHGNIELVMDFSKNTLPCIRVVRNAYTTSLKTNMYILQDDFCLLCVMIHIKYNSLIRLIAYFVWHARTLRLPFLVSLLAMLSYSLICRLVQLVQHIPVAATECSEIHGLGITFVCPLPFEQGVSFTMQLHG